MSFLDEFSTTVPGSTFPFSSPRSVGNIRVWCRFTATMMVSLGAFLYSAKTAKKC